MADKKRCDKCINIKNGFLTPAIMYTDKDIDHDECDFSCANDNKPNIFVSRVAILIGIGLIGLLICSFCRG